MTDETKGDMDKPMTLRVDVPPNWVITKGNAHGQTWIMLKNNDEQLRYWDDDGVMYWFFHDLLAGSSKSTDAPSELDELELRLIEVTEERDHLLAVAAKVPDALVALLQKWSDRVEAIDTGYASDHDMAMVYATEECAEELRKALLAQGNGGARGLISGYLPNQRAVEIILDAPVPAWMKLGGTVSVQAPASDDAEGK